MKKIFTIVTLSFSGFIAAPVLAANQTVNLSVPGMTCSVCPITVKKALKNVKGVNAVEVSFEEKSATVTFDDAQTNVETLTRATTDAGYPSTVAQQGK